MSRLGRLLVVAVATLAAVSTVGACSGEGGVKDDELAGLVVAPPAANAPVDVARALKDPKELGRALAIRHRDIGAKLGPHTVTIKSSYVVKEGDKQVEQLDDTTTIVLGAEDAYHATYENSADYGSETIYVGGAMYLRPRYANWHRRPPTDEREPPDVRDRVYGVFDAYYDLVGFAAEVSDGGAAQVAGRDGRKAVWKLAPGTKRAPAQVLTQRKWRETIVVQQLAGEAVLDADGAFPLAGKLDATFAFSRDGKSFTETIHVEQTVSGVGQAVAIEAPPPAETVATPTRSREVDERDQLLEGMAPPARRGGDTPPPPDENAGSAAPVDPGRAQKGD